MKCTLEREAAVAAREVTTARPEPAATAPLASDFARFLQAEAQGGVEAPGAGTAPPAGAHPGEVPGSSRSAEAGAATGAGPRGGAISAMRRKLEQALGHALPRGPRSATADAGSDGLESGLGHLGEDESTLMASTRGAPSAPEGRAEGLWTVLPAPASVPAGLPAGAVPAATQAQGDGLPASSLPGTTAAASHPLRATTCGAPRGGEARSEVLLTLVSELAATTQGGWAPTEGAGRARQRETRPGHLGLESAAGIQSSAVDASLAPSHDAHEGYSLGPSRVLVQTLEKLAMQWEDGAAGAPRVAQLNVRLDPAGWGSVDLSVRMQSGALQLGVRCESERTARALRGEASALRKALAVAGVELDGYDVECAGPAIAVDGGSRGSDQDSAQDTLAERGLA